MKNLVQKMMGANFGRSLKRWVISNRSGSYWPFCSGHVRRGEFCCVHRG